MSGSSDVGRKLQEERERRALQRVDVSRATGIYAHWLAAIEFGRFDELPDDRAVEKAVRAYAEHLGLDGAATVAELRAERGIAPPEAETQPPPTPTTRRTAIRIAAAIAGIVLLAALGTWWSAERESAVPEAPPPLPDPPAAEPTIEPPLAPAPDSPPPPPPPTPDRVLVVTEHGVGTAVEDHRLIGPSDRFAEGSRVWFWTRVEGGAAGDSVTHVWIRGGREILAVPLEIGGPHWRTQSSHTLVAGSAGEWTVEARDDEGNVLARDSFTCGGADRLRERRDGSGDPSSG